MSLRALNILALVFSYIFLFLCVSEGACVRAWNTFALVSSYIFSFL